MRSLPAVIATSAPRCSAAEESTSPPWSLPSGSWAPPRTTPRSSCFLRATSPGSSPARRSTSTAGTGPPAAGGASVQTELKELDRVVAHDLAHEVVAQSREELLRHRLAVGPCAVGVRIVGLERHLVGADGIEGGEAGGVVEEASVHATPVVRARWLGHDVGGVAPPAVVLPHPVRPGEDVRDPPDLAFGVGDLEVRVAHEQAREQPVGE